ncbi:MAG: VOC family protein [Bacteroidetes bacterium]|nr:VOC family protein [Bacteroidota bacterium]
MRNEIKFVHTNIIAKDWKKLAQFYMDVFECEPLYPERNLSGDWIDKMTRIPDVKIKGIHLKLPGYDNGPTLEIFEYNKASGTTNDQSINDLGFGHIAFHVSDVEDTIDKLIAMGGKKYGELIEKEITGLGILKTIYALDPEGNIIEIQNWKGK